ncbi:exonuclease domain-containing protein [Aeromicrobium choanae]|uniref:DNA polymerase III, epsilon subunit n=1 Tax=Aeromicrobium choanae TaxID=1736691 RepID=A0A1T4YW95_9ACTN|nr:exonuclease domain-containing protein [Aeromicrobium choanae]SKB06074.1 DNA polymerase III, epsilon subunit [Aeromicrobium choanae]
MPEASASPTSEPGRPGAGRRAKNVLPPREDPNAWYRQPLASLDFETTGIDPHRDRILSFAALSDVGGDLMGMVNPGVPIPESSADIHGITASDLARAPMSAQALRPVLAWVHDVIERRIGLVVYNASFDLTLLRAEAIRHDLDQPDWDRLLVVDPFVIDWGIDREREGQRRLADVAAHYGVRLDRAHDAAHDARAAREIAITMGKSFEKAIGSSLTMLMAQQRYWIAARTMDWNKRAHELGRGLTIPDLNWPFA